MKPTSIITTILAAAAIHVAHAQSSTTEKTTEVQQNADGSTTTTETTSTTFNPEARTKVVTYFDAYKTSPHGLPPAWATQVRVKEVPTAWRTTRIAPGVVIQEKERGYLVDAPAELIKVLPAASSGVHYYVAGSNVVAVDSSYRIVDSIQIPTVKFTVDGSPPAVVTTTEETVVEERVVPRRHDDDDDDEDDEDD
jgi:hypothetical protein